MQPVGYTARRRCDFEPTSLSTTCLVSSRLAASSAACRPGPKSTALAKVSLKVASHGKPANSLPGGRRSGEAIAAQCHENNCMKCDHAPILSVLLFFAASFVASIDAQDKIAAQGTMPTDVNSTSSSFVEELTTRTGRFELHRISVSGLAMNIDSEPIENATNCKCSFRSFRRKPSGISG
jgi:hypothetical protein